MRIIYNYFLVMCVYVFTFTNQTFAETIVANGSCGVNLKWELNSDSLLKISGSGSMTNFSPNSHAPWYANRAAINCIQIEEGVNSIGYHAFEECIAVQTIHIPVTVNTIGLYAFLNCKSLMTIDIPASVTSLGQVANWAFDGCSSLAAINIDASNQIFASIDGVLYNKAKNSLIDCPEGKTGELAVSALVNAISSVALEYCKKLTAINVDMENQHYSTSEGLLCNKLQDTLMKCLEGREVAAIPRTVKTINNYAFIECNNLIAINVDAENQCFSSNDGILYNKLQTNLIYCPRNKSGSVIIPNSVDTVGEGAFNSCTKLSSVSISNNVASINKDAFGYCSSLTEVLFGNGIKSISNDAFRNCINLKTVEIPNSVTLIDRFAFYYCNSLTKVTIGSSVAQIGNDAFSGCPLTSVRCNATVPPRLTLTGRGSVFGSGLNNVPVYVPCGSISKYESADWGNFFTNITEDCNSEVKNPELKQLNIYPNSATDYIVIDNRQNITDQIYIYDISGQNVAERYQLTTDAVSNQDGLVNDTQRINIVLLPKGMYLLKIGKFAGKFVKE